MEERIPVDDPIFGKQGAGTKSEVEDALGEAWRSMYGAEQNTIGAGRGGRRGGKIYNDLGMESTEDHSRIAKEWQDRCKKLPDVLAVERLLAQRKWDRTGCPVWNLRVAAKDGAFVLADDGATGITRRGMETLAGFIGVPEEYVSRLLDYGLGDLAAANVNALVERRSKGGKGEEMTCTARFIRDGEAEDSPSRLRCVASKNYAILNNVDAMEMIADAFGEECGDSVLVSNLFNDQDRVYGTMFPADRMVTLREDSDYGMGIAFRNSECLQSSYAIQPFLYRAI